MSKLNQAKEKLSQSFVDLDLAILNKLKQARQIAIAGSGADKNHQEMLNNFYNEINSLQKALAELGEENELLRAKNQELKNYQTQAKEAANRIKTNLAEIKNIFK